MELALVTESSTCVAKLVKDKDDPEKKSQQLDIFNSHLTAVRKRKPRALLEEDIYVDVSRRSFNVVLISIGA